MILRSKIIAILIAAGILLIGIPLLIAPYFIKNGGDELQQPDELKEPELGTPQPFSSEPYEIEEGYVIDVAEGWKLVSTAPERSVDRYRFEKGNAVFTLSFYRNHESFETVKEARYGNGIILSEEDAEVGEFPAKRWISGFDGNRSSADTIVKIGEREFISLYGIHIPEGEAAATTAAQIDYMAQSLRQSADSGSIAE